MQGVYLELQRTAYISHLKKWNKKITKRSCGSLQRVREYTRWSFRLVPPMPKFDLTKLLHSVREGDRGITVLIRGFTQLSSLIHSKHLPSYVPNNSFRFPDKSQEIKESVWCEWGPLNLSCTWSAACLYCNVTSVCSSARTLHVAWINSVTTSRLD